GGSAAGVAGASAKRVQQPYPILPEKKVFSSLPAAPGGVYDVDGAEAPTAALTAAEAGRQDAGAKGAVPGAQLAAQNAAASAKAAATERRGFVGDGQKRNRFDEFVTGFLSMSLFQAADVWLPLGSSSSGNRGGSRSCSSSTTNVGDEGGKGSGSSGGGGKKVSRLFLFNSNVQDPALAKWSSLSRNVVLASGVGLPGIVFQERRPQWAVDYSQVDPERNPLASVARLLGIGSAFGVPLSLGTDECGVLMLYSMSCLPPSELMVEFMERATRLLLADAPAPTTLLQQFRQNP
ncbi:unnamed protein product, partial [Hapterophycus canaliculatus]